MIITAVKLYHLLKKLKSEKESLRDGRGKHTTYPHYLTDGTHELIREHINSFKGVNSHYSLIV